MPIPAVGRVDSIAAGGSGVIRVDGLVVFVPRTAPGDLAEFAYTTAKHLGQGRLGRVVQPSPARVTPRCVHYDGDRCGGCQLQHLAYDAQLDAKRGIVRDAMTRIARRTVDIPPVVPSPEQWHYRNKLTLALRRDGAKWRAGLHRWDDVDDVFALRECPITHPRIVAGWHRILAAADALPPPRAAELRGALRLPAGNDGGLALLLEGGRTWPRLQGFIERCPELDIIRWQPESSAPRIVLDRAVHDTPAAAFAQVNPPVAAMVRSLVVERARAAHPTSAIDAYSGVGVIAAELAQAGIGVTAIEVDREAALAATKLLPAGTRVIHGRVEEALPALLPADVVVLNPPRAGVDARVCAALTSVTRRPRAVIYVSCNPATLARDIARLPAYRVSRVEVFDMFPQTAHVETVCELVPERA